MYIYIYTITWLLCAFSLVVDRDLLKDTHRWPWRSLVENLCTRNMFSFACNYQITNKVLQLQTLWHPSVRKQFSMCVYCNRSQKTSACKEQKSITRYEVDWRDCCSLHAVMSSVIYYSTHTWKNVIYLLNKYKYMYI